MSEKKIDSKLPPMLAQYREYQERYPEAILFFQVGDFYEIFFEHAPVVARTLNLTLTSRDKESTDPIPMCGVPVSVADSYIDRLVAQGFSVAVVSQTAPASPQQKGMVPRALERVVTPGIRILGGGASGGGAPAVVAGVAVAPTGEVALAITDTESGAIFVREAIPVEDLVNELHREDVAEVVLGSEIDGRSVDRRSGLVRVIERAVASQVKFRPMLRSSSMAPLWLDGFATLPPRAKDAVTLLLSYIGETTVKPQSAFTRVSVRSLTGVMCIDAATRANLELVERGRERAQQGTLYEFLRVTKSEVGAQLLRRWVLGPSTDVATIRQRLEVVGHLVGHSASRCELQQVVGRLPHFERIATRVGLGIVTPRELVALRSGLVQLPRLARCLRESGLDGVLSATGLGGALMENLAPQFLQLLEQLDDGAPFSINEAGIFRDGSDGEIDRLRRLSHNSKELLLEFEARLRAETGIASLRVKSNNVLGYFIEVTRAHVEKVPEHFVRRQSTVPADRFVVPELKKLEEEIFGADSALRRRERDSFIALRQSLLPIVAQVRAYSAAVAYLDVLAAFAEVAERYHYVAPEVDDSQELVIEEGRHPVLDGLLREEFVPNSLNFRDGDYRCVVLTGPNMGGKSTYLRQTALITILAQMGSFVPARRARIGVVDRVFARIGASDNLIEGESTFMVEMREAATIIRNASVRSLVLIDEIGRGTSTTDGLALARAIVEWLVTRTECRSICATHFHQLTDLETWYQGTLGRRAVANFTVGCREEGSRIYFTHHILEGPGNRSYGLEVAHLAGLPEDLLRRAQELLEVTGDTTAKLSGSNGEAPLSPGLSVGSRPSGRGRDRQRSSAQLPLFPEMRSDSPGAESRRLVEQLEIERQRNDAWQGLARELVTIQCEAMTPIDALVTLNRLVTVARESSALMEKEPSRRDGSSS